MKTTDHSGHLRTRAAQLWKDVLEIIPWGTQTNAKRLIPTLSDVMPPFIERARGCRMWDVDDHEYIDYRSSLGAIILGHGHPSVEAAVRAQLEKGVLFSMASPLEMEVARVIRDMIPAVDMVRFLKMGGDAVSACIRLARTVTKRDHGGERPNEAVALLHSQIQLVHVKDGVLLNGKKKPRVVGSGDMPWAEILGLLWKIGYSGYFFMEYEMRWYPMILPSPEIGFVEGAHALLKIASGSC
jgi:hypothetical protein